jgi:phthalate 3,4-dioxygenase beta subunit
MTDRRARAEVGVAGRRLLAYTDARHQEAHQFLVEEAARLDERDFDGWLELLTEDVRYRMPVRVTTMRRTGVDQRPDMAHFDEDRSSLAMRVARLGTARAWTEDPPSRTRRFVTNVRTFVCELDGDELEVESSLLFFRSRGDVRPAQLLAARRVDQLRRVNRELRLARRELQVEEAVLRTQNLALFL